MVFREKLKDLRKQNNLTQEQLAEKLYISRTAVSKWESGRGYPNIEALKSLSELFSVLIDDLLSTEESHKISDGKNRERAAKKNSLICGITDLAAISLIFLPLYGQKETNFIRSVPLITCADITTPFREIYSILLILQFITGAVQLAVLRFSGKKIPSGIRNGAIGLHAFTLCLFAAGRHPYATVLLFLLFLIKGVAFIKLGNYPKTAG